MQRKPISLETRKEFSKFCSAGGMDQLQGPKTVTIDDKSESNKDWEDYLTGYHPATFIVGLLPTFR